MKKNIMIINANREAAQIVKDNLACPSTNILCVSSIKNVWGVGYRFHHEPDDE